MLLVTDASAPDPRDFLAWYLCAGRLLFLRFVGQFFRLFFD
jgi:hypothetical protein